MFTDTHTHPYMADSPRDFVTAAVAAGVDRLIVPNVDAASVGPMFDIADQFPDNIRMAMGLHPTEVKEDADDVMGQIESYFDERRFVAVGEVGIDLYWDATFRDSQMRIFDRQLLLASRLDLPVIIHCRQGLDKTLEVLSGHSGIRATFHSFGGTTADVERILGSGDYYFGINGIVTFKNSTLRDVVPAIPTDRLLLETDSPYLAPVPYRGRPNQSAYIPFIAAAVANATGRSVEETAAMTSANSQRLFGF